MKLCLINNTYKAIVKNGSYYGVAITYTLTINPTPADATVTFSTGTVSGNSCTVADGTSVTYTVSKTGYAPETATVTVTADQTINVTLSEGHYTPDQVLYESSTGGVSTTLNLLDNGKYQVICIAGGGGGASYLYNGGFFSTYYNNGGGSGSGFDCIFQLTAGNYAVAVGSGGAGKINGTATSGGNSQFGTCYAYGGGGARSDSSVGEGGAGGNAPTLTYTRTTTTLNTTGNTGTHLGSSMSDDVASGGAAVFGTYGKGGDGKYSAVGTGNAGYVKVVYKGA